MTLGILLVVVGVVAFDALFAAMHAIFFEEGTWQFSYDSLLIRALPTGFWMGCAAVWAAALILLCLLSILVGVLARRCYGRSQPR